VKIEWGTGKQTHFSACRMYTQCNQNDGGGADALLLYSGIDAVAFLEHIGAKHHMYTRSVLDRAKAERHRHLYI